MEREEAGSVLLREEVNHLALQESRGLVEEKGLVGEEGLVGVEVKVELGDRVEEVKEAR